MMKNFFLLLFRHCPRKMWEDDKNPNTLRRINPYKIGFKKVTQRISKTQDGGGGQGRLEKFQTEADFFFGWLP